MANKESKLDAIYGLVEYSKKTGIELNDDQLRQISEREEQYIKEEVLPLLRSSIEPVLRKIQRELTLVVNYRPNDPITLRISRDPNLSDLQGAVAMTPDEIPEYHQRNKQKKSGTRQPNKTLVVTMQDGTVFNDKKTADTYCKVIQRIGLERVRNLNIMASGLNIVSTSKDPHRQQKKVGGYFLFTTTSTNKKADILRRIAGRLNLYLKIEVFV